MANFLGEGLRSWFRATKNGVIDVRVNKLSGTNQTDMIASESASLIRKESLIQEGSYLPRYYFRWWY